MIRRGHTGVTAASYRRSTIRFTEGLPGAPTELVGRRHSGPYGLLVLRGGLRSGPRHRGRARRAPYGPQGVRGQGPPRQRRPALHQGRDDRRHARRARPADHRPDTARAGRGAGAGGRGRGGRVHRAAVAGDRRRARAGRRRVLRLRADEPGGAVPRQQAGQGVRPDPPHRVQLAAVHGERGQRLQAVARRRRPARLLRRPRPRGRLPGHRRQHGRLPPHPLPAPPRPGQGGRQADRRRPPAHRHRRQGRPLPAHQAGHRPGPPQRPPAPAPRERAHRLRVRRGAHRGLGGDAGVPRGLRARGRRRDHRHPGGGHPPRRPVDRRGG